MIQYALGTSGHNLQFSVGVVAHLERHRQLRFWHRESGGLLFARLFPERISIEWATGPRSTDRRTRWSYQPDRAAEQREIDELHPEGLHFVGTWHSHAEPIPTLSRIDLESLLESFKLSKHSLNAFVLAIIGQRAAPYGLTVIVGDASSVVRLAPDPAIAPNLPENYVQDTYPPQHADSLMGESRRPLPVQGLQQESDWRPHCREDNGQVRLHSAYRG